MSAARKLKDVTESHGDWRDELRRGERGALMANPGNCTMILSHEEAWHEVLAWDEFRNGIVFTKPAPWYPVDGAPSKVGDMWSEDDDVKLQSWLLRRWTFSLSRPDCYVATRIVAKKRRVHPVRDWLTGLAWDGVKRLDSWLSTYLGVEASQYSALVGAWWMISAVARVFVPGCKADHALILEGPQALRKSTAVKVLASPDWCSDAELDWHSKDKYLLIRGRWIFELAELAGLGKADLDRVKGFMTTPRDDYRGPYEKHTASVDRQTVFVGTVNPLADGTYPAFNDPTGNRRWWPVRCTRIDLASLGRDRAQLWAEAVARYQDPAYDSRRWWPETPEEHALCRGEQEERAPEELWQARISSWLARQGKDARVTVAEVLTEGLRKDLETASDGDKKRVGTCISRAGWVCVARQRTGSGQVRVYQRSSETAQAANAGATAES